MENKLTVRFNTLVDNVIGQFIEVSYKPAIFQCMDLAYLWVFVLGYPKATIQHTYAYEVFTKPNSLTKKYFDIIPNSDTFIPEDGDIGVFEGGEAGHIVVCLGGGTVKRFKALSQNDPLGSHLVIKEYDYNKPKFLGVLRPKVFDLPVSNEAPVWLATMFNEIGIDINQAESDVRGKIDEVIQAYKQQPELIGKLKKANENVEELIIEADNERKKAKDYKKKYDDFTVALAQKLGTPADEVEIQSQVDVLMQSEDKVIELQGQLKSERETYEKKLKELTDKAGTLQGQVNTLVKELENLKKEYPELPIEIPVKPRKFWHNLVDFIQKIVEKFKF